MLRNHKNFVVVDIPCSTEWLDKEAWNCIWNWYKFRAERVKEKIHFPPFSVSKITKSIYEIFWSMITREGLNLNMMILCCFQHHSSFVIEVTPEQVVEMKSGKPSEVTLMIYAEIELRTIAKLFFPSAFVGVHLNPLFPKQTRSSYSFRLSAFPPFSQLFLQVKANKSRSARRRRRRTEAGIVLNWTINTHKSACDSFKNP